MGLPPIIMSTFKNNFIILSSHKISIYLLDEATTPAKATKHQRKKILTLGDTILLMIALEASSAYMALLHARALLPSQLIHV